MDNCACVYTECDNSATILSDKVVMARKDHKCYECRRVIKKGEQYEYVSGLCDGDFFTHKTCTDCASIRGSFFCESWNYGQILEDLRYHLDDLDGQVSSDCVTSLTPRAKEMVLDMIQKIWDERDERGV